MTDNQWICPGQESCPFLDTWGKDLSQKGYHMKYANNPEEEFGGCRIFYLGVGGIANTASTISLSILVTIEMFNTFNALSENQSLLVVPPWDNIFVVLAVALSMALHVMILEIAVFRDIFSTASLNQDEWGCVLIISIPVILLDEVLKIFTRCKTPAGVAGSGQKVKDT